MVSPAAGLGSAARRRRARSGSRWVRLSGPLTAVAGVGLATLALHLRDPHQQYSWGFCPLRELTGLDCPGCGGLRAVNDLSNLQLLDAARSNLLLVCALPVLAVMWLLWVRRAWTGRPTRVPLPVRNALTWAAVALAVAFSIYRNTPWGHWLWA